VDGGGAGAAKGWLTGGCCTGVGAGAGWTGAAAAGVGEAAATGDLEAAAGVLSSTSLKTS